MLRRALTVGLLASAFAVPAGAQNLDQMSNDHILRSADSKRGAMNGVTFELNVKEQGSDQASKLFVRVYNENYLAEYRAPAADEGKRILERGENMWFVEPDASHAVPISPRQKLLGAASYAEIAGQSWSQDYKTTSRQEYYDQGTAMLKMQLKATDANAPYDRLTLDVRESDVAVTHVVMKSEDGKVLKTADYTYENNVPADAQRAGEAGDKSAFISEVEITPKAAGDSKTTLTYADVSFEQISPQVFLLRNVISD